MKKKWEDILRDGTYWVMCSGWKESEDLASRLSMPASKWSYQMGADSDILAFRLKSKEAWKDYYPKSMGALNVIKYSDIEFPWEPKRGEKVLVSTDGVSWEKRIYVSNLKGASYPYICVHFGEQQESNFNEGVPFDTGYWKFMKKLEKKYTITVEGHGEVKLSELQKDALVEMLNKVLDGKMPW